MASAGRQLLSLIEAFTKLFDYASKSSSQAVPSAVQQASRLDLLLSKVDRAKVVLQQLQTLQAKEAALRAKYQPLLAQLEDPLQQLRPEALEKAAHFALNEGMRVSILKATGRAPPSNATWQDPFGIFVAMSASNHQAPMTWRSYLAQLRTVAEHTVLQEAGIDELVAFNSQRRILAGEMTALQRSLAAEVELPDLAPLQREVAELDAFLQAVIFAKRAHLEMLRRDAAKLDVPGLELRLKITLGDRYTSSRASEIIERLRPVHLTMSEGHVPPVAMLEDFEREIRQLGDELQALNQPRGLGLQVNEQKYQKLVYDQVTKGSSS